MLHDEGVIETLPCFECPSSLSEAAYLLVSVFTRAASVHTSEHDGKEKRYVEIDWMLVSLLLEEESHRAALIRDIADLRHAINT